MDAAKEAQIKAHALALAELLYEQTDPEQVKTLKGIKVAGWDHLLEHVEPEGGIFYPHKQPYELWAQATRPQHHRTVKPPAPAPAARGQGPHPLESPDGEKCCLLSSATEAYPRAAADIVVLNCIAITDIEKAVSDATPDQGKTARQAKNKRQDSGHHPKPIVTQIEPASAYWLASEEHQQYFG